MRLEAIPTASGLYTYRGAAARAQVASAGDAANTPVEATRNQPTQKSAAVENSKPTEATQAPNRAENLSRQEEQELKELKKRDREVRAHEQAHLAAAGGHALGGPRYTYQVGPDGKRYAVGGEVPLDASKVPNNPQATILKAQAIRRAALAPANPSAPDKAIAAEAAAMAAEARRDLVEKKANGEESASSSLESSRDTGPVSTAKSVATHSYSEQKDLNAYAEATRTGAQIFEAYA